MSRPSCWERGILFSEPSLSERSVAAGGLCAHPVGAADTATSPVDVSQSAQENRTVSAEHEAQSRWLTQQGGCRRNMEPPGGATTRVLHSHGMGRKKNNTRSARLSFRGDPNGLGRTRRQVSPKLRPRRRDNIESPEAQRAPPRIARGPGRRHGSGASTPSLRRLDNAVLLAMSAPQSHTCGAEDPLQAPTDENTTVRALMRAMPPEARDGQRQGAQPLRIDMKSPTPAHDGNRQRQICW